MPELPEVEIIKTQLSNEIVNKKIISTNQNDLKLHGKSIPDLTQLVNETFLNIYRRNKYLILETKNYFLVIHLGMTGQLIFDKKLPEKQKHIHAIFNFNRSVLYYQDIRRFGSINLFSKSLNNDYLKIPLFKDLGFEPLDLNFSIDNLKECIKKSTSHAKSFIMNGNFICGIGNIYACEILFLTKIHPETSINLLTNKEIELLFNNIISVLNQAVSMGGSTISDFVHLNGNSGKMQDHYYVYGRVGENCKICNNIIEKIKQNGRSSFYCPFCQKKKTIKKIKK